LSLGDSQLTPNASFPSLPSIPEDEQDTSSAESIPCP